MQIKGVYPSTFGSQGTDEDTLEHKHTENESVNRTRKTIVFCFFLFFRFQFPYLCITSIEHAQVESKLM
jgi:hypothetical protein